MSIRIEKINDLIRDHLGEIFQKRLSIKPGVFITIPKTDTAPDLKTSKVYLSVFPTEEKSYVKKTIDHELHAIQKDLNHKLSMRVLPKLTFIIDDKQEKISEIEEVFEKIRKEREVE